MIFTVGTVAKLLAEYLEPVFPTVQFIEDPVQQGVEPPCMFVQQRFATLRRRTGGYWLRKIGLDLTYLLDYNLTDMQQQYQTAAEALDLVMETFPYKDYESTETVLIRTHNREWNIDANEMHYKFDIEELVTIPKEYAKMQKIEEYREVLVSGQTKNREKTNGRKNIQS